VTFVPLKGGFYQAPSLIANAQQCTNLYPEKNPEDSPAPFTMRQAPGLRQLAVGPTPSPWRGLYTATNKTLYGVCGPALCSISPDWQITVLGLFQQALTTPVSMKDNGTTLVAVDGTAEGIAIALANNGFSTIGDPNFVGATTVDYVDSFLIFNQPQSRNFYASLSNVVAFDPTYVAAKTGFPDLLSTLIVMRREIWLLGAQASSEVWYNNGGAAFPFAIVPGAFIEHGCVAPYSVAKHDLMIFWLGVDKDGISSVYMGANQAAQRISTPAVAHEIQKYARLDDAIGMTYKQDDHVFYVLTFPTADVTWVYDLTEKLWHRRSYLDANGIEHRHRANCMAFAYGTNVVGDFANGNLYAFDLGVFDDAGSPIVRRRSFPHLLNDGKRMTYGAFRADMQYGEAYRAGQGNPWSLGFGPGFGPVTQFQLDEVYLRWSDTRGRTFGNPVGQPLGPEGAFETQAQWRQLGMGRDRVFELFWAMPVETALQGAWIDATPAGT
jgi:hypothetical protein